MPYMTAVRAGVGIRRVEALAAESQLSMIIRCKVIVSTLHFRSGHLDDLIWINHIRPTLHADQSTYSVLRSFRAAFPLTSAPLLTCCV
jgi:hypothetical protein